MIMNLLSVSLVRFKLVISSRAINNCLFEKARQKGFLGGGPEFYNTRKQKILWLWKHSGSARSSFW
jgi:hypothetical protein